MSFENFNTNDLVRIAAAGGGFKLSASLRDVNDLVRIAAAASKLGSQIIFTGVRHLAVNDLVRISAAGKGAVFLEQ